MYRWPIRLLEGPGPSWGGEERLWLEIPPRGAAFTLPCLMHLGHPIHLALIDAYLRGAVPFPRGASLGWDSRAILANLVGPLVLLYAGRRERASLADLLLLPPGGEAAGHSRLVVRSPDGRATRLACASASSRRTADLARAARAGPTWHHVITVVPEPGELRVRARGEAGPAPVAVVSREPEDHAVEEPSGRAGRVDGQTPPSAADRSPPREPGEVDLREVTHLLTRDLGRCSHVSAGTGWQDLPIAASLVAEPDGGSTFALLPEARDDPGSTLPRMEDAAWATLEVLIGAPIAERRGEAIVLRLVGPNRTTELAIGRSLVLPRNRRVFAAWLGSDGRVLIRLAASDDAPAAG